MYVSESYKQKKFFSSPCFSLVLLFTKQREYKFDINFGMKATKNRRKLENAKNYLFTLQIQLEKTLPSRIRFS